MASIIPSTTAEVVALTKRIGDWLTRLGVPPSEQRSELVVGLADILSASHHVAESLDRLLATDPTSSDGADAASKEVGLMWAWLGTEMKNHVDEVLAVWEPMLETPVIERCPPDPEDEVS